MNPTKTRNILSLRLNFKLITQFRLKTTRYHKTTLQLVIVNPIFYKAGRHLRNIKKQLVLRSTLIVLEGVGVTMQNVLVQST